MVQNYNEFCDMLIKSGFSMGGGSDKGIYAIVPFDWTQQPEDTPVRWHTGDMDTDPWEWRTRVLEERSDIAYAKVFFKSSGYITEEWYPYFLAVRRKGKSFEEMWQDGLVSEPAKRIYYAVSKGVRVAAHDIKRLAGLESADSAQIEKALTELQMKMYITICGKTQKLNKFGEPYGWSSMVYSTPEEFWHKESFEEISPDEAADKIRERISELNPEARQNKIQKFIFG